MLEHLTDRASRDAIPIEPIAEGGLERWLARQRAPVRSWVAANRFLAKPGQHLLIPDAEGRIGAVALGVQARAPGIPWPGYLVLWRSAARPAGGDISPARGYAGGARPRRRASAGRWAAMASPLQEARARAGAPGAAQDRRQGGGAPRGGGRLPGARSRHHPGGGYGSGGARRRRPRRGQGRRGAISPSSSATSC